MSELRKSLPTAECFAGMKCILTFKLKKMEEYDKSQSGYVIDYKAWEERSYLSGSCEKLLPSQREPRGLYNNI
jgi:hypothetical protein